VNADFLFTTYNSAQWSASRHNEMIHQVPWPCRVVTGASLPGALHAQIRLPFTRKCGW